MKYYKNYSLKNYNSFHLHSFAKNIWLPETKGELCQLLQQLKGKHFNILAGGTNVLLNEVINRIICLNKIIPLIIPLGHQDSFLVSNSYHLSKFISDTVKKQLTGLEGLIGIPGTVGGAIIMNAGSGEYTISDYLQGVTTIDLNGNQKHYQKKELQFGRRYSILQDKKEILISALFTFKKQAPNQELIKQVREYRKDFPKGYSAGGIFINHYALRPYEKEIRAIKSSNLAVSKQLNVIINKGNATFKEIISFINKIKAVVKEPLHLEIKIIGEIK